MSPAQLEAELLRLDEEVRARLLARILATYRQPIGDEETQRIWVEEARRRDAAIEAGEEPEIPAEEVFQQIRGSLRG
jgi:hypothetical protein